PGPPRLLQSSVLLAPPTKAPGACHGPAPGTGARGSWTRTNGDHHAFFPLRATAGRDAGPPAGRVADPLAAAVARRGPAGRARLAGRGGGPGAGAAGGGAVARPGGALAGGRAPAGGGVFAMVPGPASRPGARPDLGVRRVPAPGRVGRRAG